jgi:hypothetical protein
MIDIREEILVRLVAVAATIPTIRLAQRNNIDIPEDRLPAAIVLDGDEETHDSGDASMRLPSRPTLVDMHPDVLLIHQDPNAGSELDSLRRELIRRILFDAELNEQIVKTGRFGNGAIRYLGCQVGVGYLRDLHAGLKAQFLIKYKLNPSDL